MTPRIEENPGILFVLSGPSGVGKGAICRELLFQDPRLALSISVTTRAARPGEVEGRNYYFRTEAQFEEMADRGEFLEWARVYGHYYGTPRQPVLDILDGGGDVLLEIDIQGALKVKQAHPAAVLLFVAPPSEAAIMERLNGRGSEGPGEIAVRMACLVREMRLLSRYDYAVVNDTVLLAVAALQAVMHAEHARAGRYRGWMPGGGGESPDDERTAP